MSDEENMDTAQLIRRLKNWQARALKAESEVAQLRETLKSASYGGGGHRSAAGFSTRGAVHRDD